MGHVEPDGAAAGSGHARLWALWRALKAEFPLWSLLPSAFATPGAWGYVGVDFLSGFRANPSTRRAFDLLTDVDAATFDALCALAALNVRRHEQLLKAVVIAYLTVPITVLAVVAEVAGDTLVAFVRDQMQHVVTVGVALTFGTVSYYLGTWRANQIVGVLDLIRIERGQAPFLAVELRDD
jgi:hypothetical protein